MNTFDGVSAKSIVIMDNYAIESLALHCHISNKHTVQDSKCSVDKESPPAPFL